MKLTPVIGLEIHVQLKTKSKIFCSCSNRGEFEPANTTICPVCTGQPGVLPVLNEQALKFSILAASALNCQIAENTKFDRKNYFYPDLPKGYQISQYDIPIAKNGFLDIDIPSQKKVNGTPRQKARISINRLHLEEDAAKLLHSEDKKSSYVDYNRAGTPLLEIVSEPDLCSPLEAKIFLQELRSIMRYLDISDAEMEMGQMRCDANISLREVIDDPELERKTPRRLNPKTEIKNLNSFRSVEHALEYEIKRQTKLWDERKPPEAPSTRGWNDKLGITEEQRAKEESHDYRYFPEPDLPMFNLKNFIPELKTQLPELPQIKRQRFQEQYGLDLSEARILTDEKEWADFTEKVITELKAWLVSLEEAEGTEEDIWKKHKRQLTKLVSGWIINKLMGLMANEKIDIRILKITPENFAEFITLIHQSKISGPAGLEVLKQMLIAGQDPSQIIEEKHLEQISGAEELETIARQIIKNNPKSAEDYKQGKENALQFLVGQIMKETRGKANPQVAGKTLKKLLDI